MAKTYRIETSAEPLALLARARESARDNGATLVGDERSGRFSHGLVKGDYRVVGQTLLINVTEKHWMIPWHLVESRLGALVR